MRGDQQIELANRLATPFEIPPEHSITFRCLAVERQDGNSAEKIFDTDALTPRIVAPLYSVVELGNSN